MYDVAIEQLTQRFTFTQLHKVCLALDPHLMAGKSDIQIPLSVINDAKIELKNICSKEILQIHTEGPLNGTSELEAYFKMLSGNIHKTLQFWKANGYLIPNMFELAKLYLSSSASTADVERTCKALKLTLTVTRNRMLSETLEMLIYLKKNSFVLQDKFSTILETNNVEEEQDTIVDDWWNTT